ncbi:hypothetical protein [Gordonia malaquae]|uniref:hypothetical protein n=1 Tax=Gordonia malaquae TaxID=410332 RepID=UPI0030168B67
MLGTETVTVAGDLRRDSDGKVVPAGGAPVDIDGCLVTPLSSAEAIERGRESSDSLVRVQLPITAGITKDSVLIVRGLRYTIDGDSLAFIADDDPELSGYDVVGYRRKG